MRFAKVYDLPYLPTEALGGFQAPGDTGMSGSVLQGTELAAGDPLFSPGLNFGASCTARSEDI